MTEKSVSSWATQRFGAAAPYLARVVPEAIGRAHTRACAAHLAAEEIHNDAYGNGLAAYQHEELLALASQAPQLLGRRRTSSRFDLLLVTETKVALWPWRFATDHRTTHRNAKFRTISDFRRALLTLTAPSYGRQDQLSLDDVTIDQAAEQDARAEEEAMLEQLRVFGSVVTVGYSCNPSALFELGWGDCELLQDGFGGVYWSHWEPLGRPGSGAAGVTAGSPVMPTPKPTPTRFDDGAPSTDDFDLSMRHPLAPPPTSEPLAPDAGAAGDDADDE